MQGNALRVGAGPARRRWGIYSFGSFAGGQLSRCYRPVLPGAVVGMLPLAWGNLAPAFVIPDCPEQRQRCWECGRSDVSRTRARGCDLLEGEARIRQSGECESPD
jgi:hypothetical protein